MTGKLATYIIVAAVLVIAALGISFLGIHEIRSMASKRAIADLLEFDDIVVGTSWLNSAKPGQAPQRIRLWGSHCALLRLDRLAGSDGKRATFGWTAQFGTPVSGSIPEPKMGLRGSQRVRAGESLKEVIAAPDLGYFFQDVA